MKFKDYVNEGRLQNPVTINTKGMKQSNQREILNKGKVAGKIVVQGYDITFEWNGDGKHPNKSNIQAAVKDWMKSSGMSGSKGLKNYKFKWAKLG